MAQDKTDMYGADTTSIFRILLHDVYDSAEDLLLFGTLPLSFQQEDWASLAAVTAGVGFAMQFDARIDPLVRHPTGTILDAANLYGDLRFGQALTATVYFTGLFTGSDDLHQTGRMLFKSILYSGLVTSALKMAVGRARPYVGRGSHFFEGLEAEADQMSFPSGHTTVAFAVSTVLAEQFENTLASIALYTTAGLTGITRMVRGQHWLSDVLMGAAIGYSTGKFVSAQERLPDTSTADHEHLSFLVVPTFNGIALYVRL